MPLRCLHQLNLSIGEGVWDLQTLGAVFAPGRMERGKLQKL